MTQILFVRHAETDLAGRFCGHSDPELNARGRDQLVELVAALSRNSIGKVYSSDLKRAHSTALAIAEAKAVPIELRPALREINFGDWEGLRWEEIERGDPEHAHRWSADYPNVPAPGGESFPAFEQRVLEEVEHLLHGPHPSIAVATHAGVMRVVLQKLCGASEQQAWEQTRRYCCAVRYEGTPAQVEEHA